MTDIDLSKAIDEFFEKDKSGDVLYNSPVWKSIVRGVKGTGRKIKFLNRGKDLKGVSSGY